MRSENLIMGVIGTSTKENEFRAPIHPSHLPEIAPSLRKRIFFEAGYGQRFRVDDGFLETHAAGVIAREELFERCDVILLPKPTQTDFPLFREGQVLWGWPHCVQGEAITQLGIDKKMTFIAWEAMFLWKSGGVRDLHIFHKNNEMAGYCSVLHALQLAGITGHYGTPRRAAVISFGSTGRGAIHALMGQGYTDVTLFTQRPYYAVHAPIPSVRHRRYRRAAPGSPDAVARLKPRGTAPMAEELAHYDIIVNCILQDTDQPFIFIQNAQARNLKPGTFIIDVSCDAKMGFEFATPTSFERPTLLVGDDIIYYAVDHSPSYLWNAASFEISRAVLPYIETVLAGEDAWEKNEIIRKAIEIKDGVVLNSKILRYQGRAGEYPHLKRAV
jgi:alanine dehydrogenase